MNRPGKLRALLATLRIANAPSVVSNVFLGYVVGFTLAGHHATGHPDWHDVVLACMAGVLLYFSGNLANDWFDRRWDAEKRPERALPSGTFRPASYLASAVILALAGTFFAFALNRFVGGTALAIVLLIGVYTVFHKKARWAVIPMGLCRAALYFLGFFAFWFGVNPLQWWFASPRTEAIPYLDTMAILGLGLFSYIAGLSLSARYEGMEDAPRGPKMISLAMLVLPLAAMSCMFIRRSPMEGLVGMIPFAVWLGLCLTVFRKPIPRYVSALLAGIPLVDLIAMAPLALDHPRDSIHSEFTVFLAVPVAAFILGRALQKLAPAT